MVHGIVEYHGAVIEVESAPGSTCVQVYLPVGQLHKEQQLYLRAKSREGQEERILLLDDEPAILR